MYDNDIHNKRFGPLSLKSRISQELCLFEDNFLCSFVNETGKTLCVDVFLKWIPLNQFKNCKDVTVKRLSFSEIMFVMSECTVI